MNPFVISLAIRLTILLLAGGLIAFAVQRSTSAVRHLVIAATLACVIALPITMIMVPEWRVGVLPASHPVNAIVPTTATAATVSGSRATIHPVLVSSLLLPAMSTTSIATSITTNTAITNASLARPPLALTPPQIALGVWLLGVMFGLAWIAIGRLGLARVRRRATPLTTYEWRTILEAEAMHAGVARHVALLTSPAVSMPVTWGVLSPVIVLPETALSWSHDRKRVVVMHEMAHIARRDSATQFLATLACVAYWLHPLVILAARRLRAECERACDERVLERGTPAAEYAAHLLDVARLSRSFGAASIVSVAMARPSQLEGRLLAVLRATPRNSRMSVRTRAATTIAAATMLLGISAFKPVVREAHARDTTLVQQPVVREKATKEWAAVAAPIVVAAPSAPAALVAPVVQVAPVFATLPAFRAFHDSTFAKSVPARSGGTLDLDLDTGGDIIITGSDDSTVSVQASLGGRDWAGTTVTLDGSSGDARLQSRYERSSGNESFDNSFTIRVPRKYNVHVSSAGGGITIADVDGNFTGSTGGGRISITHATGVANLSTGGGSIRISKSHLDGSVMTGFGAMMFDDVTGNIVNSYSARRASGTAKMERWRTKEMNDTTWARDFAKIDKMRVMINDTAMVKMRKAMESARVAMLRDTAYMEALDNLGDINRDDSDSARKYRKRSKVYMKRADSTRLLDLEPYRLQLESSERAMDVARQGAYATIQESELRPMLERSLEIATDEYGSKGLNNRVIVIDKSGGSIEVREAPHGAHVITGGGAISIGPSSGAVSAVTGGGDIEIGPAHGSAAAATGAGDVQITMAEGDAHPVNISTGKGDVELTLPKDANVTLDLETAYTENFGKATKIKGDWPLTVTETSDWDSSHGTPRKYVRVRQKLGNGGPIIRVRTVNGDIKLKRMD